MLILVGGLCYYWNYGCLAEGWADNVYSCIDHCDLNALAFCGCSVYGQQTPIGFADCVAMVVFPTKLYEG